MAVQLIPTPELEGSFIGQEGLFQHRSVLRHMREYLYIYLQVASILDDMPHPTLGRKIWKCGELVELFASDNSKVEWKIAIANISNILELYGEDGYLYFSEVLCSLANKQLVEI